MFSGIKKIDESGPQRKSPGRILREAGQLKQNIAFEMKPAELDRKWPWSGSAGFVLLTANGVSDNSSASGLKQQGRRKRLEENR